MPHKNGIQEAGVEKQRKDKAETRQGEYKLQPLLLPPSTQRTPAAPSTTPVAAAYDAVTAFVAA